MAFSLTTQQISDLPFSKLIYYYRFASTVLYAQVSQSMTVNDFDKFIEGPLYAYNRRISNRDRNKGMKDAIASLANRGITNPGLQEIVREMNSI